MTETERETDRETERETERETDRETECSIKYSKKYLNMSNQDRIKYNKCIRESLDILESIKNQITEEEYTIIYNSILRDIRLSV